MWEAPSLPYLVSVAQISEDSMSQERRNHFCVWVSRDCDINNHGLLHQAVAKGHEFVLILGVSSRRLHIHANYWLIEGRDNNSMRTTCVKGFLLSLLRLDSKHCSFSKPVGDKDK